MKLAAPLKFGVGVKTTLPATTLTVPPTAEPAAVMVTGPSPRPVSLANRLALVKVTGAASSRIAAGVSATAKGVSLTAATLMATVSLSVKGVPAASVDSTVRVSAPLKSRLPR